MASRGDFACARSEMAETQGLNLVQPSGLVVGCGVEGQQNTGSRETGSVWNHCRANLEQIRLPRPDSGPGLRSFQYERLHNLVSCFLLAWQRNGGAHGSNPDECV